jgi:Ca2+-binding EF-hand superfamily protein
MTEEIPPDRLREVFAHHDRDKDNRITAEELRLVLNDLGQDPTDPQLQQLLSRADVDSTGGLDLDDFMILMNRSKAVASEDEIVAAFSVFDKDGDGKLTKEEFELILKNLGEPVTTEEIQDLLQQAGGASGGVIDFRSFIHSVLSA